MAKAIISYQKEVPEIAGRRAWERPTSFLTKDVSSASGWREDNSGRRASKLLLISKLRDEVDVWREGDRAKGIEPYAGASKVTQQLFKYWFHEDHDIAGFPVPFRYYFCQREAIETLAYVFEIAKKRDSESLIRAYAQIFKKDLLSDSVVFQTTMDGQRQVRRYVAELEREGVQDLPPKSLSRFAFKMATGSGKTWVMAMAIVWSYFNKKFAPESELATNFLIVAPNVIVYQRLERDFGSNRIFNHLPLVPPAWKPWTMNVILRGEGTEPDAGANLFLTNIHQLYEARDGAWTPTNAVDALLGRKPAAGSAFYQRSMLDRMKGLKNLVVINDEAHHVHDEELEWNKSLMNIHRAIRGGLALWLDFSATPKDQNGMYYPWTICDYPLAQAVEDRIVKAPIIVTKEDDPKLPKKDPEHVTKTNVTEKYGYWIRAAVQRWLEHTRVYKNLGTKPVLFIMAEKNVFADMIGRYLWETKEFKLKESEVLVIHTDEAGEITKKSLDVAREAARDIDKAESKIRAIVSVMMLREGWDVKSVTVALGLRPFDAQAEILPEQVVGRGLRLMTDIGPDHTQTLEVLGTRNLLDFLRKQLEAEGVGIATTKDDPPLPVTIYPVAEKAAFDIAIPLTKPQLVHNFHRLSALDPLKLEPIYEGEDLNEVYRHILRMEFAPTETEIHKEPMDFGPAALAQELLSSITTKVIQLAHLANVFAELYPVVRSYVAVRCFGRAVDVEQEFIRKYLGQLDIQEGIAKYLARAISDLTLERRAIEFENANFKLSNTKPFGWRRNLPPRESGKTVFNYVATYNDFEKNFAEFLHKAKDVVRFASLGTTEQGESGTQFRVDYLKPNGAIGFYHPDWVVVQQIPVGQVNWILETKGRVWEGTEAKDVAMENWCARITECTGARWNFKRINQANFDRRRWEALADLLKEEKRLV